MFTDHVTAVYGALPRSYALALLVLDATGMRVGELEHLRWGDVDEPAGRWRVSRARTKTKQARWVPSQTSSSRPSRTLCRARSRP